MGLVTGIIVMITCLTGAILVYEHELQHVFSKKRYFTENKGAVISADSMLASVKLAMPKAKAGSIKIYNDPTRNAEVAVTVPAKKKESTSEAGGNKVAKKDSTAKRVDKAPAGAGGRGGEGTRLTAFVDPYTGKVIEFYNHRESFLYFTMDVHRWMLGGDTGKIIVGICTLVFCFIIITGIVLWWPRNKQILKQRLKIKSDAGFKRLNHDYHVVLGFYSAIFLFVFAFTGLAWSFQWFNKGIYTVTGSSMERPKSPKNVDSLNGKKVPVEMALQAVIAQNNNGSYYNITIPKDSADAFAVNVLSKDAPHESASDTYFIDAHTGAALGVQTFAQRNLGQRVRATFKPVHTASIYGQPSKLIGFITCLLGTFFPLSGIIMWINRTWRKKPVVSR